MWKNSQSLSVDGCQTVSSASESLPGLGARRDRDGYERRLQGAPHRPGGVGELHGDRWLVGTNHVDIRANGDPRTGIRLFFARHLGVQGADHRA